MVEPAKKLTEEEIIQSMNSDGWENVKTGLGRRGRDKRLDDRIKVPAFNIDARHYGNIYTGSDVARRLVEIPNREMLREWITVRSESSGESSTEERMNIANEVMRKLDDLDAQDHLFDACLWSDVHGGSVIFLGVDDGVAEDGLEAPLDMANVRSFDFLAVFDRHELRIESRYGDISNPKFGQPEIYALYPATNAEGVSVVPTRRIHETRLLRFDGKKTTKRRMMDNNGWADSIFADTEQLIADFQQSFDGVFHLLRDFSQMVYKLRGIHKAIASDNEDLVINRIAAMDMCRSVVRGVVIDTEEDAERHQTPVSGLPELLDRAMMRLAQSRGIPVTLLMGRSPAGQNATGESDMAFFYDGIRAKQNEKLKKPIKRLIELIFAAQDGPDEPDSWSVEFNPLFQMDEKEQAEIRHIQAQTDAIYQSMGSLTTDEITMSRFGGDSYSTETTLDLETREADQANEAQLAQDELERARQELELLRANLPPQPSEE